MFADWPLLSLSIWLPILGGVIVLMSGEQGARRLALLFAIATFAVTIPLYTGFDTTTQAMQFREFLPWLPSFNINYHLGIDGISLPGMPSGSRSSRSRRGRSARRARARKTGSQRIVPSPMGQCRSA